MIRAADCCPCLGCGRPPARGQVLCEIHERSLPGIAHRHYLGALAGFLRIPPAIEAAAATLALLCASIAYREGIIGSKTFLRCFQRYSINAYAMMLADGVVRPGELF